MRLVTIRIESDLKYIIDSYAAIYDVKIADFVRDLLNIGIILKKMGGVSLQGPLGINVPLEEVILGEDQERLNFYVDEDLLNEAHQLFGANFQSVLRKAIRLGFYCLLPGEGGYPTHYPPYRISPLYPEAREHRLVMPLGEKTEEYRKKLALMNYVKKINELKTNHEHYIVEVIIPFLERTEGDNILIITGKYGSGRSTLFNGIISIAENKGLTTLIDNPKLSKRLEKLAGKYHVIKITSKAPDEELVRKLGEELKIDLEQRPPVEDIVRLWQTRNPESRLLIAWEIGQLNGAWIKKSRLIEGFCDTKRIILDETGILSKEMLRNASKIDLTY